MAVRRLRNSSWQYDFKIAGYPRQRKGGFSSKEDAYNAELQRRSEVVSGKTGETPTAKRLTMAEAFEKYLGASDMRQRTKDSFEFLWRKRIDLHIGHLYLDEINTLKLDELKVKLRKIPSGRRSVTLAPASVNHHLQVIKATLRYCWMRGLLKSVPYVPMEKSVKGFSDWYTTEERDLLLDGIFRTEPDWYLFFYLTCRLGLRCGEVYAITYDQIREHPPRLVVDRAVQRGTKARPALIVPRKNDEAYAMDLTADVFAAIQWHQEKNYGGEEYLFSKDGKFPAFLDSHRKPLLRVQRALELKELSHHKIGRHSVASQAATGGESIKAIQAQLGHKSEQSTHRYAHLGSGAQLRVIEGLKPEAPPHQKKKFG